MGFLVRTEIAATEYKCPKSHTLTHMVQLSLKDLLKSAQFYEIIGEGNDMVLTGD